MNNEKPFSGFVIACIAFFLIQTPGQAQIDTSLLFVFAKSGLKLRTAPNLESETIKIAQYGHAVKPLFVEKSDTIEQINGNWLEVDYRGEVGFMFDGYLSRLPRSNLGEYYRTRETDAMVNVATYFDIVLQQISEVEKITIKDCGGDPDCKQGIFELRRKFNKNFEKVEVQGWDLSDTRIIGHDWSFLDAQDLIESILFPVWKNELEKTKFPNGAIKYEDKLSSYSINIWSIDSKITAISWEASY